MPKITRDSWLPSPPFLSVSFSEIRIVRVVSFSEIRIVRVIFGRRNVSIISGVTLPSVFSFVVLF